jgi:hypothetical protein
MCIMYMMPGPSSDGEFNTASLSWLLVGGTVPTGTSL